MRNPFRYFNSSPEVIRLPFQDSLVKSHLSFPKIISGRIGGAVQSGSEW